MANNTELALGFEPTSIASRLGPSGCDRLIEISTGAADTDLMSLQHQLSMHMPRFSVEENLSAAAIVAEAERLAARLHAVRRFNRPVLWPWSAMPPLRSLRAEEIDATLAEAIFDRYHYLLSHRTDTFSVGLRFGVPSNWPFVVAALSPFDLRNMADRLQSPEGPESILVVSRMFGFPGIPHNAISYFLGQLRAYLSRTRPHVRFLVTYVNPNVGFDGASYRADNWQLLGHELGTTYSNIDQNYCTERRLGQEYGTADSKVLTRALGERFQRSCHVLKPLLVLARSVRNEPWDPGTPSVFPHWSPAPRMGRKAKPDTC